MKIYAVVISDTSELNWIIKELWDHKAVALDRARKLEKRRNDPNCFCFVEEFDLNKEYDPDSAKEQTKMRWFNIG